MVPAKAIGGYFEFSIPGPEVPLYPQALRFQSARAAFLALLRNCRPRRVWMPNFNCDAMMSAARAAAVEHCFYSVDQYLGVDAGVRLDSDDILLYVNYFGLQEGGVDKVLARFDPQQVVLDYSQAFYAQPRPCLATVYSPRKFLPLPDGGLLVTDQPVEPPVTVDDGSLGRMTHLLRRFSESPEAGYSDYLRAETSLEECVEPRSMSALTSRLLNTADVSAAKTRRGANFLLLHSLLGEVNQFPGLADELSRPATEFGPLCYPCWIEHAGLRGKLIAQRIFVPTYWPEVRQRAEASSWAARYVDHCLPLPCDQRYGAEDMRRIAEVIRGSIG